MTALTNLLERLSKLERAGTRGKWKASDPDTNHLEVTTDETSGPYWVAHIDTNQADTELIAAARNALPMLIHMLRVAVEQLQNVEMSPRIMHKDNVVETMQAAAIIGLTELNRLASEAGLK